ncbi:hypothetical protein CHLNCDRAFT_143889 [Chlorella variabilis]|uniref:Uncharacterized protein n=1 Tax=Chlorella variabilis TaxID=554065 RepID=E1ZAN9_CHLVA|nr:hypothetical protein CHLNCDRAFT_143889 [Chlorella variabilis]EFN57293.1 hypothetical protein CHLNCDRAFT_143889 [Chlorella variabilis]|eukprot:XP_005849395.1 hypothetical protein CHLNCDRAFT_143889 [Chlorella variabilis]
MLLQGSPSKPDDSLHGTPAKPTYCVPPKHQPLPFPLVWLAIASLSAITVLGVAHSALTNTTGAGSARARRLLQRGHAAGLPPGGDGGTHAERGPGERRQQELLLLTTAGGSGGGSSDGGGDDGWQQEDGGGEQEDGGGGGRKRHPGSRDGAAMDEILAVIGPGGSSSTQQVEPGVDLATFAAPGTHCAVTPSHGKVALLFLTHGDLPHAAMWTDWMRAAAGLLPRGGLAGPDAFCLKQCDAAGTCARQCGAAAACNPLCVDALRRRLGPGRSPSVLAQQHLFSVYVHARPTLKDYPEGLVFQGRLIPDRIVAKWGTHALAAAAKRLVEAAVLDQRNERFVLVGDTTVPLYHPALMWQQLMHDARSRLDSCWHEDLHLMRRRYNPTAMSSDRFKPDLHWRKSSQWFVLNRKHADLVAADREVVSLFGKHCNVGWDEQIKRHRDCISDEHYLPSLLAMHGLDNEASCAPPTSQPASRAQLALRAGPRRASRVLTTCDFTGGTYASWEAAVDTPEGGHPKLYQPGHIGAGLFAEIRLSPGHSLSEAASEADRQSCAGWKAATQAARSAFVDASSVTEGSCPATLGSADYLQADPFAGKSRAASRAGASALGPRCLLLARKFSQPAAKWVHRLYRSCTADLGILPCSQELSDQDKVWWRR